MATTLPSLRNLKNYLLTWILNGFSRKACLVGRQAGFHFIQQDRRILSQRLMSLRLKQLLPAEVIF
jgi:hypothetical protein